MNERGKVIATRKRRRSRFFDYVKSGLVIAFVTVGVVFLSKYSEQNLDGQFIVVDGDSLAQGEKRIRLIGIDAPELFQTCSKKGKVLPCGKQSRAQLRKWVSDADVTCTGSSLDQYDRLLAVCRANGENLNEKLVQNGWALAYGAFEKAEANAKQNKLGIWAGDFVPPRDWRKAKLERRSAIWSWLGL